MSMKIIRGTTPTLEFVLPFEKEKIQNVVLTFMQNGEKILSFEKDKMEVNTDELTEEGTCNCIVVLTEEDTLSFNFYPAAEKNIIHSQFKFYVEVNGGIEVFVSNVINFRVYGDLDGVSRLNKESERNENNL